MLSQQQLLGLDQGHLVALDGQRLESRTAVALRQLQEAAHSAGFDVQIASGWRSFERQLAIFNGKARGQRPLLDKLNQPLCAADLDDDECLNAILFWSALPGASRHHWGTDLDLYDGNAIDGRNLKLEPWEYQGDGPNAPLHHWLCDQADEFGFFFPYREDLGGVQPEPWHLSFAPVSQPALARLSMSALATQLRSSDIALKAEILARLPQLAEQYLHRISPPPGH
ncbi:LD-carboxypeptidase LdcB, LAS superfamily [Ferrimonas sediminum]|uniref:LD-carboxypeptidase LdcB, LAS superfamily n=1 Tax=Ferrimonas sediminum TaxID=718193 RepID=A0A1G8TU83_9GAMM|nr:M15 family metallopeptidase [Ferrimonas sediminum]SDJ45049.1 LD-carboxypeptidase LdcB, LAS superfamily [Ferrimonas sediminum]